MFVACIEWGWTQLADRSCPKLEITIHARLPVQAWISQQILPTTKFSYCSLKDIKEILQESLE